MDRNWDFKTVSLCFRRNVLSTDMSEYSIKLGQPVSEDQRLPIGPPDTADNFFIDNRSKKETAETQKKGESLH